MTEHDPTIAVTYLRVSTTRQMDTGSDVDAEGNSIATQREACNARAAKLGAVVQHEFVEPGASAQTISKRPVFKQLLSYLEEHPEVGLVIIYVRSRAFRNLGDAVITKRRLEEMGVKLVSAKEDFGEGIMADAMEAVTDIINEVQVRMNGEDIKTKMRHKAERGGTNGRAPVGYKNVRLDIDGRQVNGVVIDEERAPLVRQAFELYATGDYSITRLHETMADLGLTTRPTAKRPAKPLSHTQVHALLQNPYFAGWVSHKGDAFRGTHDPIISQDLFDRVQQVLRSRSSGANRDRVHHHYLKGVVYCQRCYRKGHNTRLVFTEVNGNGGTYQYFMCLGRQRGICDLPYLPVVDVEWHVADHYARLGLPPEFVESLREGIDAALAEAQQNTRERHDAYRKQLSDLDRKEERLLDLAVDGAIPRERIKERLRTIKIDRQKAQNGLQRTHETLERGAKHVGRYLDLLDRPEALYAAAPDEQRRELNTASFEVLRLDEDGVHSDRKTPLVEELHELGTSYIELQHQEPATRRARIRDMIATDVGPETKEALLGALLGAGSSKTSLVPPTGFEPALPP